VNDDENAIFSENIFFKQMANKITEKLDLMLTMKSLNGRASIVEDEINRDYEFLEALRFMLSRFKKIYD